MFILGLVFLLFLFVFFIMFMLAWGSMSRYEEEQKTKSEDENR